MRAGNPVKVGVWAAGIYLLSVLFTFGIVALVGSPFAILALAAAIGVASALTVAGRS